MPTLVRHRTEDGIRFGVIVHRGRKWLKVHYVAHPSPTRMPVTEERYISDEVEMTNKQIRRFNQSVVSAGGKRGTL